MLFVVLLLVFNKELHDTIGRLFMSATSFANGLKKKV